MKKHGDWFLPDHEQHLQAWMAHPKNSGVKINGRVAYQGRKQLAALELCKLRPSILRAAVDVGAHCGLWAFNLEHAFTTVHAFEPMALHRECFKLNVPCLDGTLEQPAFDEPVGGVYLYPYALGEQQGMVRLESEKGSSGNTRIVGDGDIELRTLDSFEFAGVDLIKIDCEGYELHVLRGAVDTIARCKPVIVVEQKRDMAEQMGLPKRGAVDFLVEQGYRLAREISGDFFMVPV